MMKLYFIVALTLYPILCLGQVRTSSLTLDQLKSLSNKDVTDINSFLMDKGWEFEKALKEDEETAPGIAGWFGARVFWSFRPNKYQSGVEALLQIEYDESPNLNYDSGTNRKHFNYRVEYRCNAKVFMDLKKEVAAAGMKKYSSRISEYNNSITEDYVEGDTKLSVDFDKKQEDEIKRCAFRFRVTKDDNGQNLYTIISYDLGRYLSTGGF
ncbi:hypothetical protein H8S95_15950 [Pontibacter sp. KCTC 32443]|uniref:hypothetical protein n=1 Tax=Pontibacter TaxID=323449 RepID=UPI00164D8DAC|nr:MULTISPECIES: hypothetical protein [Pontibacter]MBC5775570.1 hypothetical protein [Pontibacter sp. KCTC 32443]